MVILDSTAGHDETLVRLRAALADRQVAVFAEIDHAAAAREVGMELGPEVVIVFGNPRAGTPLMEHDRRVGIELPLRMLVWEDAAGCHVGYNDPRVLAGAYDLARQTATLEAMAALLAAIADAASRG